MIRTRLALWNYLTGLLYMAVTLVAGLIATPWLLHWLGEERFGAARTTWDWFGYVALLELGLGAALPPLLAQAVGQEDADAVRRTLATGIRAYLPITLAEVLVGVALASSIPWLIPVSASL